MTNRLPSTADYTILHKAQADALQRLFELLRFQALPHAIDPQIAESLAAVIRSNIVLGELLVLDTVNLVSKLLPEDGTNS